MADIHDLQLLADSSYQLSFGVRLPIVLVDLLLEDAPKAFDWSLCWSIWRVLILTNEWNPLLLQPVGDWSCIVASCQIWPKNDVLSPWIVSLKEGNQVRLHMVDCLSSRQNVWLAEPVRAYGTPHHHPLRKFLLAVVLDVRWNGALVSSVNA